MGAAVIGVVVTGVVAALSGGLVAAVNRRLWRGSLPCDHAPGRRAAGDRRLSSNPG